VVQLVALAELADDRVQVGRREAELEVRGGGGQAHQVVVEAEGHAAVGAQRLEEAAAVEEAAVRRRDRGLLLRKETAVQPDHGHVSVTPSARAIAAALASVSSYSAAGSESAVMPPPAW